MEGNRSNRPPQKVPRFQGQVIFAHFISPLPEREDKIANDHFIAASASGKL
jgi:hypothetical protein